MRIEATAQTSKLTSGRQGCQLSTRLDHDPATNSSISSFETARQSAQSNSAAFSSSKAMFRLSQLAQAAVGSPDPGAIAFKRVLRSKRPTRSVFSWNVLRQSAQMWLKQHLGSQV